MSHTIRFHSHPDLGLFASLWTNWYTVMVTENIPSSEEVEWEQERYDTQIDRSMLPSDMWAEAGLGHPHEPERLPKISRPKGRPFFPFPKELGWVLLVEKNHGLDLYPLECWLRDHGEARWVEEAFRWEDKFSHLHMEIWWADVSSTRSIRTSEQGVIFRPEPKDFDKPIS